MLPRRSDVDAMSRRDNPGDVSRGGAPSSRGFSAQRGTKGNGRVGWTGSDTALTGMLIQADRHRPAVLSLK